MTFSLITLIMLLSPNVIIMAETYQGYAPQARVNCQVTPENEESSKESTGSSTSSSSASDADPFTEGTTAYNNAKKVFTAFIDAGLTGEASAGIIGWVNSEGGFAMIGRAEGHYGNSLAENSISKGVRPTGLSYYTTEAGGGIFQFTPFTKYAPLGSSDWEDADKMVKFVIHSIKNGDWNKSYDESGHGWSFEEFAKQTNIDDTAMSWNAYERGNMAYVKPDQKKGDARKFAKLFNASKYKYDANKFDSVFGGSSSSDDSKTDKKKRGKKSTAKAKTKVDNKKAIEWYEDRKGKVSYSMTARNGAKSYDCSSSVYYALTNAGADTTKGDYAVSTETEHEWLMENGYKKVYEGNWKEDGEIGKVQEGDVFIWGEKGGSSGANGHTGMFKDDKTIIHCNFGENGISENEYESYKHKAGDHGKVYIYRQEGAGSAEETTTDECAPVEESSKSTGGSGWSAEGGTVSGHRTFEGWKPNEVPDDIKPYAIDPKSVGLDFSNAKGWNIGTLQAGQCTALTAGLGYALWEKNGEHPSNTNGNGFEVASNWASKFGGKVTTKPKAGSIFSQTPAGAGGTNGHTGLVSHVFANGDLLLVEQNFNPLSGAQVGMSYSWNYRYVAKADIGSHGLSYYDPSANGYKISDKAKALK